MKIVLESREVVELLKEHFGQVLSGSAKITSLKIKLGDELVDVSEVLEQVVAEVER